jgi:hypothetical protein
MPFATPTPPCASDFLVHAAAGVAAVVVADGSTRNAWPGRERSTADGAPDDAVFAEQFGGQSDLHNDGRFHRRQVSVLVRSKRYADGIALAEAIHDRMDLTGAFAVSGRRYIDCRADGPGPTHIDTSPGNDHEYFEESFTVWFEQL